MKSMELTLADVLAHYHMFDYHARCAVAITTDLVRDAKRRHELDPMTTIALGRALSCAALLASTLKAGSRDYVHLSFASEGLLAKIVAECNGDGNSRGYAVPARLLDVFTPGTPLPESIGQATGGKGILTVTRGTPHERSPYNAVLPFQNGEIASDVARYLTDSEQIPSAVAAGVKLSSDGDVVAAGGVLVQKLGGTDLDESVLVQLEHRMALQLNLSDRIAAGESIDDIVAFLQGGTGEYGLLTTRPLAFKCSCSRDRMASALVGLGEAQLRQIRRDTGKIEVRCQYCGESRHFRLEELLTH